MKKLNKKLWDKLAIGASLWIFILSLLLSLMTQMIVYVILGTGAMFFAQICFGED